MTPVSCVGNVFIGQTNLPTITHMSIGEAMSFFEGLHLTGQKGQIAEKILKEIRDRLSFLINVGLNYLSLELILALVAGMCGDALLSWLTMSEVSFSIFPLFQPIQLGNIELKNRIVMPPMTRSRATQPGSWRRRAPLPR